MPNNQYETYIKPNLDYQSGMSGVKKYSQIEALMKPLIILTGMVERG